MTVYGLIHAFEEEATIADAVRSLFTVGCEKVVVVDGAWTNPDGSYFGGGGFYSTDQTLARAQEARATVVRPPEQHFTDGGKRDWALSNCGFQIGDQILLLDADEVAVGTINRKSLVTGHACVIHRDLHENDLTTGGAWPRGDWGPEKPLMRWLRWDEDVRCEKPGVYFDSAGRIHAYLVGAMAERAAGRHDTLFADAHRAIRDLEEFLPPATASLLPVLESVEIHHATAPSAQRVEAKHRYYTEIAA